MKSFRFISTVDRERLTLEISSTSHELNLDQKYDLMLEVLQNIDNSNYENSLNFWIYAIYSLIFFCSHCYLPFDGEMLSLAIFFDFDLLQLCLVQVSVIFWSASIFIIKRLLWDEICCRQNCIHHHNPENLPNTLTEAIYTQSYQLN